MNRRNFLKASAAALILPGIVRAENIMRINPPGIIQPIFLEFDWKPNFHFKMSDTKDVLAIYSNHEMIWSKPGWRSL